MRVFGFYACMAIVLFFLASGIGTLVNHVEFAGDKAQIEQLRNDIQPVSVSESKDVRGQVTQWNQKIARMQTYNGYWWGDPYIPDGWDDIKLIEIPQWPFQEPQDPNPWRPY